MQAKWDNEKLSGSEFIAFEAVKPAKAAIPNEIIVRKEEGKQYIYVVLNGNNTVVKMDLATKEKIWTAQVGVAPFGIASANNKIYVTNWAGGIPGSSDQNVAGVPWGSAKVDSINWSTREGTVSVVDPETGNVLKEIMVGLHPNNVVSSNDSKFIYVANANSDNVSSISTKTDEVTETISVRLTADKNPYWGDSPNGLAVSHDDKTLFVANGMDNAVAMLELGKTSWDKMITDDGKNWFPVT